MSKTASLRQEPANTFFGRLLAAIDLVLTANAVVAARHGDVPISVSRFCFDAFSSREPVSTSLENALNGVCWCADCRFRPILPD